MNKLNRQFIKSPSKFCFSLTWKVAGLSCSISISMYNNGDLLQYFKNTLFIKQKIIKYAHPLFFSLNSWTPTFIIFVLQSMRKMLFGHVGCLCCSTPNGHWDKIGPLLYCQSGIHFLKYIHDEYRWLCNLVASPMETGRVTLRQSARSSLCKDERPPARPHHHHPLRKDLVTEENQYGFLQTAAAAN